MVLQAILAGMQGGAARGVWAFDGILLQVSLRTLDSRLESARVTGSLFTLVNRTGERMAGLRARYGAGQDGQGFVSRGYGYWHCAIARSDMEGVNGLPAWTRTWV